MGEYSIKTGDNLWNIVKREFKLTDTNDIARKVNEVVKKNNIKDPDSIFAGQKIVIDKDAIETPLLTSSSEIKLGSNINTPKFDFSKERPLLAMAHTAPPERITPPRDFIKADPKVHGPNPDAPIPERDVSRIKFNNTQTNEDKEENVARKRYSEDNPSFFAKYLKFDTAVDRMKKIMKKNEEKLQLPGNKKTEKIDDIKTIMDEIELEEYSPVDSQAEEIYTPPKPRVRKVKGAEITSPRKVTVETEKSAEINRQTPKTTSAKRKTKNPHSINVTTKFTGTAEQLDKHLGGVLKGKGAHLLRLQELYGINAAFLAAIAINESENGNSYGARRRNNVGGVRIPGTKKFQVYVNVEACLDDMADRLKKYYIDEGRTTIGKIGEKYCPTDDDTDSTGINKYWPRNVSSKMTKIDPSISAHV